MGHCAFVPRAFWSSEVFQLTWSENFAIVAGARAKLQVVLKKLSRGRAFLVRAYLLPTHEILLDAHWHAFRVVGGVPGRGNHGKMKAAVDRIGRGK
ncbi:hypothetical protein [Pararhodobacter sp. CCB-MM2]|uniref:hypothetical protein n=1 Tax=Pararhodobacter sp. CCB-MM2 TaxID=1786003 RepID=UPI0008322A8B|nr:hypothetical protein [Pararhodobacter sp. CCB-MM2]